MAELTLMLMTFGFYSHEEQLRDIVHPLIVGLDHNKRLKSIGKEVKHTKEQERQHQESLSSHIRHDDFSNLSDPDDPSLNTSRRDSQGQGYFAAAVAYIQEGLPTSVGGAKVSPTDGPQRKTSVTSATGVPVAVAGECEICGSWLDWTLSSLLQCPRLALPCTSLSVPYHTTTILTMTFLSLCNTVELDDDTHLYKTHRQMETAKRKATTAALESNSMFEAIYLRFTESIPGITLSMFVVFLTVTVSCLQVRS